MYTHVCVCREEAHSLAHMHSGAGEIRADGFICLVIARLFDVVTAYRWTLLGLDFFSVSLSAHECTECMYLYACVHVCACEGKEELFCMRVRWCIAGCSLAGLTHVSQVETNAGHRIRCN